MKTYREFQPTGFDAKGLGLEDKQDWLVAPCGTSRDATLLSRCNWESQLEILREADPEGGEFETHRFTHWGPGWFQIMLVMPGTKAAKAAEACEIALSDSPILSEDNHSNMEWEEKESLWTTMRLKERVKLCGKAKICIMKARHDDMPDAVGEFIEVD